MGVLHGVAARRRADSELAGGVVRGVADDHQRACLRTAPPVFERRTPRPSWLEASSFSQQVRDSSSTPAESRTPTSTRGGDGGHRLTAGRSRERITASSPATGRTEGPGAPPPDGGPPAGVPADRRAGPRLGQLAALQRPRTRRVDGGAPGASPCRCRARTAGVPPAFGSVQLVSLPGRVGASHTGADIPSRSRRASRMVGGTSGEHAAPTQIAVADRSWPLKSATGAVSLRSRARRAQAVSPGGEPRRRGHLRERMPLQAGGNSSA